MTTSPAPEGDPAASPDEHDLPPGLPADAQVVEHHVETSSFRSRTAARERALSLLYEAEMKTTPGAELLASLPVEPDPYTVDVLLGVSAEIPFLDGELARVSQRWDVARMPALDRALLRMGTWELARRQDVPVAVVINEAVELAKRFSTDDSGRFVNGVLSRLASDFRQDA